MLPNFEGKTYDSVIKNPDYDIYDFADPVEEHNDAVPAGEIISQTPKAGEMWTEGTLIRLTVSLGPELVAMPTL